MRGIVEGVCLGDANACEIGEAQRHDLRARHGIGVVLLWQLHDPVLVAAVFSPKVATEISPPVSGSAHSKLQIFGIGAVAGSRPDALVEARQGQSGERIEGDRFDPRFTTTGAEHLGHRAQGWF